MDNLLHKALEAISLRIITATGLSHPDIGNPEDWNTAAEMFQRLHRHGTRLISHEIESWAEGSNWLPEAARELGELARQVGYGEEVRIEGGPWWREGIIESLTASIGLPSNRLANEKCSGCLMRLVDRSGNEECLMEVIRSQWAEPFGNTRYCEHPELGKLVSLVNSNPKRLDFIGQDEPYAEQLLSMGL